MTDKTCSKCREIKAATLEFFAADKKVKSGLFSWCRTCQKEDMARRRAADPEKAKAVAKRSHEKHRESRCAIMREDRKKRLADPVALEAERARQREKSRADTLSGKAQPRVRAYRERHKDDLAYRERVRAVDRQRYVRHKPKRLALAAKSRAARRGAPGEWDGYDVHQMFVQQSGKCLYCGCKVGKSKDARLWHIDHFIPISRGGTNFPDNLVLACEPCNREKYNKMPWEWLPDRFTPPAAQ